MLSNTNTQPKEGHYWFPLITSIAVTVLLFFIDEGYYNFNWMADFGNWVAFAIYVLGLFVFQLIFQVVLFRKLPGFCRDGLSFLIGVPLALYLLIGVILG